MTTGCTRKALKSRCNHLTAITAAPGPPWCNVAMELDLHMYMMSGKMPQARCLRQDASGKMPQQGATHLPSAPIPAPPFSLGTSQLSSAFSTVAPLVLLAVPQVEDWATGTLCKPFNPSNARWPQSVHRRRGANGGAHPTFAECRRYHRRHHAQTHREQGCFGARCPAVWFRSHRGSRRAAVSRRPGRSQSRGEAFESGEAPVGHTAHQTHMHGNDTRNWTVDMACGRTWPPTPRLRVLK